MNVINIIKKTERQFRFTLLIVFLALIILHYTTFNFSPEVISSIVGTMFIGTLLAEYFYFRLLEKLKDLK